MKLTKLIIKNFKIIMRSRISSLIIIFGPLLIMLLAGYAFNNSSSFELNVGAYIPQESELTGNFSQSLDEQFNLLTYTDQENCISDVRNLKLHSCLVFSSNFMISEGNNNSIEIYVDNSKVNIVDLIQNALNKVIVVQSSQIGADLASVLIFNINQASDVMDSWQSKSIPALVSSEKGLVTGIDVDRSKWSSLAMDYTPKDPVINDINAKSATIKTNFATLVTTATSAVTQATAMIAEIKTVNVTGITTILDDNELALLSIQQTIYSNSNVSTASVTALQNAITQVSTLVNEMSTKISQVVTLRADLVKRFDSYKQQLSTLEASMNALAGQIETESTKLKNIKIKDVSTIVSPVTTKISPVVASFSKLNYIFPSLMMLVIMFVCIMLSATVVVIEKLSPAKFRLFTTPTSDITFIMSNFVTTLIVALFQIILMICIAAFVFHIDVLHNILNSAAILFIGAIVFTLIGMCLGYIFANEQTTILGAISIGSAFILVSDLILPLESIALELRVWIAKTPFVLLTSLLRRTVLFDANIKSLGADFYLIVIYCVSLFAIIVIAHKLLKVIYLFNNTKKNKKKA